MFAIEEHRRHLGPSPHYVRAEVLPAIVTAADVHECTQCVPQPPRRHASTHTALKYVLDGVAYAFEMNLPTARAQVWVPWDALPPQASLPAPHRGQRSLGAVSARREHHSLDEDAFHHRPLLLARTPRIELLDRFREASGHWTEHLRSAGLPHQPLLRKTKGGAASCSSPSPSLGLPRASAMASEASALAHEDGHEDGADDDEQEDEEEEDEDDDELARMLDEELEGQDAEAGCAGNEAGSGGGGGDESALEPRPRLDGGRENHVAQGRPGGPSTTQCDHPGFIRGLCIRCAAPEAAIAAAAANGRGGESADDESRRPTRLRYIDSGLVLTKAEADRQRSQHLDLVRATKRLILVLDLDHTLLNSVRETDLHGSERRQCEELLDEQRSTVATSATADGEEHALGGGAEVSLADRKRPAAAGLADGATPAPQVRKHKRNCVSRRPPQLRGFDGPAAATPRTPCVTPAAAMRGAFSEPSTAAAGRTTSSRGHLPEESPFGVSAATGNLAGVAEVFPSLPCPLCYVPEARMYTKLRPGARNMLRSLHARGFEVYVYTMGDRPYALAMCRLLDPAGHILDPAHIIARTDRDQQQGGQHHRWRRESKDKGRAAAFDAGLREHKDLNVIMGHESAILIVDDSIAVWPKHADNLLVVERYHFWRQSCRAFHRGAYEAVIHKGKGRDSDDDAWQLRETSKLLMDMHKGYFDMQSSGEEALPTVSPPRPDVRTVLKRRRLDVLRGVDVILLGAERESRDLGDLAMNLGARVHLLASSSGSIQPFLDGAGADGVPRARHGPASVGDSATVPGGRNDIIVVAASDDLDAVPNGLSLQPSTADVEAEGGHGLVGVSARDCTADANGGGAHGGAGGGGDAASPSGSGAPLNAYSLALLEASRADVPVVKSQWLRRCFFSLTRVECEPFLVGAS